MSWTGLRFRRFLDKDILIILIVWEASVLQYLHILAFPMSLYPYLVG